MTTDLQNRIISQLDLLIQKADETLDELVNDAIYFRSQTKRWLIISVISCVCSIMLYYTAIKIDQFVIRQLLFLAAATSIVCTAISIRWVFRLLDLLYKNKRISGYTSAYIHELHAIRDNAANTSAAVDP